MLDNSKEFSQTLYQVLNTKIKAESKQDIVLQSILKKYDKNNEIDFQEMLRKNIKLTHEDIIKKEFEPKFEKKEDSKEDLKEYSKEELNVSQQVKSGADLDKIANNLDDKTDDEVDAEKSVNSFKTLTNREETLKYMYCAALEEYYALKETLYKSQVREGNIALDDKNYIKLLQYENYIRKCDMLFKSTNGTFISNQDEEISKKENKYAYEAAKNERKLANDHEDSIAEIDNLNTEIENKADEIMDLNYKAKNGNVTNFEEKLNLLEKEYTELTAKMHMLKPNIFELYRQEQQKEEQENITTRVIGTTYEKEKNKSVMDQVVVRLDKKVDSKEDLLYNATTREKNELESTNIKLANSYIDAAENALENDDLSSAKHMVNKAKKIVGQKQVESISKDKKTDFEMVLKNNISSDEEIETKQINQTEIIDKHLEDISDRNIELSPVQEECAKAVYTPEERAEKALIREELEKENDEINKENDIIR